MPETPEERAARLAREAGGGGAPAPAPTGGEVYSNPYVVNGRTYQDVEDATGRYIGTVDVQTGGRLPTRPTATAAAPVAPATGRPALTEAEVLGAVKADGGFIVRRGGVLLAVFSDGSIVKYDPAGVRGGATLYDPIYSAPSDTGRRMYQAARAKGQASGEVASLSLNARATDGSLLLTAEDIIAAAEKPGVQFGELIGTLRPSTTGLAARPGIPGLEGAGLGGGLPLTEGGVYEEGGLQRITPGLGANVRGIEEFRGFIPGAAGQQAASIGYTERVSGRGGVLDAFGVRSSGDPAKDFATAQRLQTEVAQSIAAGRAAGLTQEQAFNEAITNTRNRVTLDRYPTATGIDLAGEPLFASTQPFQVRYGGYDRPEAGTRYKGRSFKGGYLFQNYTANGTPGNVYELTPEEYDARVADTGPFGGEPLYRIPRDFGREAEFAVGGTGGQVGRLGAAAIGGVGGGFLDMRSLPFAPSFGRAEFSIASDLGLTEEERRRLEEEAAAGAEIPTGTMRSYRRGGSMTAGEEIIGRGRFSGRPYFRLAEGMPYSGRPERLTIRPLAHGGEVQVTNDDDEERRPRLPSGGDELPVPVPPFAESFPELAVQSFRAVQDREFAAKGYLDRLAGQPAASVVTLPFPVQLPAESDEPIERLQFAPPPPRPGIRYEYPRLENQIADLQRQLVLVNPSFSNEKERITRQINQLRTMLRAIYGWLPQKPALGEEEN